MADKQAVWRGLAVASISVGLSAALAPAAQATEFKLTLSGVFNGTGADPTTNPTETLTPTGGGVNLLTTANEPFTLTGIFNSFDRHAVAAAFNRISIDWIRRLRPDVGDIIPSAEQHIASPPMMPPMPRRPSWGGPGLTVAIFDTTQVFGPGHYAAGFIAQPLPDGAGIVGDFQTANPPYRCRTSCRQPTGVILAWASEPAFVRAAAGSGVGCATTPIPLDDGLFQLTLGN